MGAGTDVDWFCNRLAGVGGVFKCNIDKHFEKVIMEKIKIHLEDNGQDLLWLVCGEDGRIVDAGPFQSSVWVGGLIPVWDDEMLKVGEPCPIHTGFIKHGYLKHKIEKIETIEN